MTEAITVIPRDIHFNQDGAASKTWLGGDPVGTAVFNALSLTFPDGERLFMDAVRQFRGELSGRLLEDTKAFISQEAIHSREHVALNAMLDRKHYPVDAIEAEIRDRIATIRGRGPMAMLCVTIALEHFTAMMADRFLTDEALFAGAPKEMTRLWQWHAMEETEHKGVAFDVFIAATKTLTPRQRRRVRAVSMAITTVMFVRNITRYSAMLLRADGMGSIAAHGRVLWYLFGQPGLFRKSWRAYGNWFGRNFHPWNHGDTSMLETWRTAFPAPEGLPRAA